MCWPHIHAGITFIAFSQHNILFLHESIKLTVFFKSLPVAILFLLSSTDFYGKSVSFIKLARFFRTFLALPFISIEKIHFFSLIKLKFPIEGMIIHFLMNHLAYK